MVGIPPRGPVTARQERQYQLLPLRFHQRQRLPPAQRRPALGCRPCRTGAGGFFFCCRCGGRTIATILDHGCRVRIRFPRCGRTCRRSHFLNWRGAGACSSKDRGRIRVRAHLRSVRSRRANFLRVHSTREEVGDAVGGVGEPLGEAREEGSEEAAGEAELIGCRCGGGGERTLSQQLLLTKSSCLANSSFATNGVANSLSVARDASRPFVQARCAYSLH